MGKQSLMFLLSVSASFISCNVSRKMQIISDNKIIGRALIVAVYLIFTAPYPAFAQCVVTIINTVPFVHCEGGGSDDPSEKFTSSNDEKLCASIVEESTKSAKAKVEDVQKEKDNANSVWHFLWKLGKLCGSCEEVVLDLLLARDCGANNIGGHTLSEVMLILKTDPHFVILNVFNSYVREDTFNPKYRKLYIDELKKVMIENKCSTDITSNYRQWEALKWAELLPESSNPEED